MSVSLWISQGARGDQGYTGQKGEKGDSGSPGPPGLPGRSGLVVGSDHKKLHAENTVLMSRYLFSWISVSEHFQLELCIAFKMQ